MAKDTQASPSTATTPRDAHSHRRLQENWRKLGCEFSDSFWWKNMFLNTFTLSFSFLWKTTTLSEKKVCLFSLILTPGSGQGGLRNILPVTDLLPKDTSASGLKGKTGSDVPGRPTTSSYLAKGKLFLMVQKTLCRANTMMTEPGWTDTTC